MILKTLLKLLFPETTKSLDKAVLGYNGMSRLVAYHQLNENLVSASSLNENLGERPWYFVVPKKVIKDLKELPPEREVILRSDGQTLSLIPADDSNEFTVLVSSAHAEVPSWEIPETIYLDLTPTEWGKIEAAASIVGSKHFGNEVFAGINLVCYGGNSLEVIATSQISKTKQGLRISEILNLDTPLSEEQSLNIIIPVEAIALINEGNESVSLEIGKKELVLRQGNKSVRTNLIEGDYPPIGLIPDGEVKAEVELQRIINFLTPKEKSKVVDRDDTIAIKALLKDGKLFLAAANQKTGVKKKAIETAIAVRHQDNYPESITCTVAASVVLDAVRLMGVASMAKITLSLPIGLQCLTILAGATRFVLPTIVDKATQYKLKEILNPEPLVRATTSTTVDVGTEEEPKTITMTTIEVEHIPEADEAEAEAETSPTKGLENLATVSKRAKKMATQLSPDVELEAAVSSELTNKVAEAEEILEQADTLKSTETLKLNGCPLSQKDISKLVAGFIRIMNRIQTIVLKSDKSEWSIEFTFDKSEK